MSHPSPEADRRRRPRRDRLFRSLRLGGLTAAVVVAGTTVELLWAVNRRLPSLVGLDASGTVGAAGAADPLRLVVLGDSTLTGPGLPEPEMVWLRQALDQLPLDRAVHVLSLAVGGSRAADLASQVDRAIELRPDLVVLAVGANDAFHGTRSRRFADALDAVLRRLLDAVPVVGVTNLGDLGNVARFPRPANAVLRARSRSICATIERVVAAHERAVLVDVTSSNEAFRDPGVFGADLFHPNELGHSIWAAAARPGLAAALARLEAGASTATGRSAVEP